MVGTKVTLCYVLVLIEKVFFSTGDIVNVALNRPASMSSYYGGMSLQAGGAVDGNTSTRWPNIICTAENQSFAWWKVDLQREVQDSTVRIYFRTDYRYRRNGVKLYTSKRLFPKNNPTRKGQLCHTVTGDHHGANIPDIFSTKCTGRWRYLMVYTDTSNDNQGAVLDFGEVEVDACDRTSYGVNCSKSCSSRHCSPSSPRRCDTQTGQCPGGCEPGWTGVDCTSQCPAGTFGSDCTSCSTRHCQGESDCPADGTCSQGCQDGWTGNTCIEACDPKSYGVNCSKSCSSRHCSPSSLRTCDPQTGQCPRGCESGWTGVDCTQECYIGLNYGVNCSTSCIFRHCVTSSTGCDLKTGQCPSGCEPGWTGLDCTKSFYGPGCKTTCGNCFFGLACHHVTGNCSRGCKAGWRTNKCDQECPAGTFGSDCTSCSTRHCQGESDCPPDGTCSQRCQDEWTGNTCTQKCPVDTFGSDCTSCSTRHCQGESDCPADGTCSQGCQDGWTGHTCTQKCPAGTFGSDCTSCSTRHCQGESDCPADGTCSQGCQDGWIGNSCACKQGELDWNDVEKVKVYSVGGVVGVFAMAFVIGGIGIILHKQGRLYLTCQATGETSRETGDVRRTRSTGNTTADQLVPGPVQVSKSYTQTDTALTSGDIHYESVQNNVYQNNLSTRGQEHPGSRLDCQEQGGTANEGSHYELVGASIYQNTAN